MLYFFWSFRKLSDASDNFRNFYKLEKGLLIYRGLPEASKTFINHQEFLLVFTNQNNLKKIK